MGYKKGFIQKLKLCWFWLTTPARKNMLTSTCEFCGSSNLVAVNSVHDSELESKTYSCKIICMSCKAQCDVVQKWHRHSDEFVDELRKRIRSNDGYKADSVIVDESPCINCVNHECGLIDGNECDLVKRQIYGDKND